MDEAVSKVNEVVGGASGMPEAIKTAITTGATDVKDYAVDGIAAIIPIGMSILAIRMGIRIVLNLFHSLTNA